MAVINARPNPVEVNIEGETHKFSIMNDHKTFHLLQDKLYTKKIRAVVRELWTNALDSHTAAGCPERPFDTQLPTALDPVFKVRDYGTSMDHETIMRLYTTIGYSTSEGSNDFVGAMGLGSKSPFSYTDHFTVTAWKDGEKRIYTAYYDEDGIPTIKHIVTLPSDEEQGIEVAFAVKGHDFPEFDSEAHFLAIGFDVTPNGLETHRIPEPVHAFKNWRIFPNQFGANFAVRMGSVIYPVSRSQIQFTYLVSDNHTLVYDVPIGAVDVAASREALSFDKGTEEFITKITQEALEEIGEFVALQFADCKTILEAEIKNLDFNHHVFRMHSVPFKNKKLNGHLEFTGKNDPVVTYKDGEYRVSSFNVRWRHNYEFLIVRSDQKMLRKKLRIKEFFKDNYSNHRLMLTDPSPKDLERLVRRLDLKPHQIIPMVTLPDVQVVAPIKGGKGARGIYVRNASKNSNADLAYLAQPDTVDLTQPYYWMEIDKRATTGWVIGGPALNGPNQRNLRSINRWWNWQAHLLELGIEFDTSEVYIFTSNAAQRLKPNPDRRFDDAIWNTITELPGLEGAVRVRLCKEQARYHYSGVGNSAMQAIFDIDDDDVEMARKYERLLKMSYLTEALARHFGVQADIKREDLAKQFPLLFGRVDETHALEYVKWRKECMAKAVDNEQSI